MDEVGRGTTVKDGLAIAFATLHHLVTINKSRCLFATHFHELAEMLGSVHSLQGSGVFHNVRFYCSDVDDAGVCFSLRSSILLNVFAFRMVISHIHTDYVLESITTAMA